MRLPIHISRPGPDHRASLACGAPAGYPPEPGQAHPYLCERTIAVSFTVRPAAPFRSSPPGGRHSDVHLYPASSVYRNVAPFVDMLANATLDAFARRYDPDREQDCSVAARRRFFGVGSCTDGFATSCSARVRHYTRNKASLHQHSRLRSTAPTRSRDIPITSSSPAVEARFMTEDIRVTHPAGLDSRS